MTDSLRTRTVQFRVDEGADEGVVRGYVTTWDQPYNIGYGWNEEIARGCFSESLVAGATPVMWQHDWDAGPIGVSRSMTEDDTGLLMEAELFLDDPRARSIYRAMKAGALREWSIGFYAEEITEKREDKIERVTKGRLAENSVVVRGANPNTKTLEVRSSVKAREDDGDVNAPCPECGYKPDPNGGKDPAGDDAYDQMQLGERDLPLLARLSDPHVRELLRSRGTRPSDS